MNKSVLLSLLIVCVALVLVAGCTGNNNAATPAPTAAAGTAAGTAAATVAPTQATTVALTPEATTLPDKKYEVAVDVNKDDVYGTITAEFRGGAGLNFVDKITVDVYYPDGTTASKELSATNVGNTVTFDGNKFDSDRVKVTVSYMGNIGDFVILDKLVPEKVSQRARD